MEYAACAWRAGRGVCRCCLSEGCYKDIATEYYWMGERELYQDMLRECFDLTISYQDGGTNSNSRLICEVCITRLRDASNFKKQVINAEKRFAEHILTGSKLSDITEAAPAATFQEVKLEGVKDETGISDDDDMGADEAATDDPDYDPDYDESDMLPLKFEVQKKEALVEFSFGDEMPTLNTNETTIRRVSKSKGKSPSKKIKMSKKELTIKPIKASGSKVAKVPKAPKPAKVPVKKGRGRHSKEITVDTVLTEDLPVLDFDISTLKPIDPEQDSPGVYLKPKGYQRSAKALARAAMKRNATIILDCSTVTPFRWWRNCFVCAYCDDKFTETDNLRLHSKQLHRDESINVIYKKFKELSPINVDLTDSRCRHCDWSIGDIDKFKEHLSSAHGKVLEEGQDGVLPFVLNFDNWQCTKCEEVFNNFLKLYEHMNTHYQNYICDSCGKGYMTAPRLRKHSESHATGTFPCGSCEQVFTMRSAREHHKIRFHMKGPRYECPHCLLRFSKYYERMKHLSEAHDAKVVEYKCFHCDLSFETSSKRSFHVRTIHLPQEKKFGCSHCAWYFVTKYELKRHMVRHTGEREFHCKICEKSYPRVKTLREHMRLHNNDRRFVCAVCGQAFLQKCSLKQHLRAHHPERAEQLMEPKLRTMR